MDYRRTEPQSPKITGDAALETVASRLSETLEYLAGRVHPFPSFMGMATIQALEVEPTGYVDRERGCVVIRPDGRLYELTLTQIPGAQGVSDVDQVEELRLLELPPEEFVVYASAAILALVESIQLPLRGAKDRLS